MGLERERTIDPRLHVKTKGFLIRAHEEYEDFAGIDDLIPLNITHLPSSEDQHKMKNHVATAVIWHGFEYLAEHAKNSDLKRVAQDAKDMLLIVKVKHTYFGDVPELLTIFNKLIYIQPQPVPDETPYFAVAEAPENKHLIVVPELWLINSVSEDPNVRIEALALLAHTASYMYGFRHENGIKEKIRIAKEKPYGPPNPSDQDEFIQDVERRYIDQITKTARRRMGAVLLQASDELLGSGLSRSERKNLGFSKGNYIPTREPFREIFHRG